MSAPDDGPKPLGALLKEQLADLTARMDRSRPPIWPDHPEYPKAPDAEAPVCARCNGGGYLRRNVQPGHPDFGRPVECPCGLIQGRRMQRIWEHSQVPETMRGYTLESFAELTGKHELVSALRDWQASKRWALFVGPVGLGKTGLAIALLNEQIASGSGGLYVVTPSYLARIRATYKRVEAGEIDETDVLRSAVEAPLLVLDDLGKVKLTDWGQEKLFTVVDERCSIGRRTIVTSNLDTEDGSMEQHLWPATWDRIRGQSEVFRLTGSSLRGLRS